VDEQCSQESAVVRGELDSFYGGLRGTTREMEGHWGVIGRAKRSEV